MKHFLTIIFLWFLLSFSSFAAVPALGKLALSDKQFSIAQVSLPVYKVFSNDYVALFPLADFGYEVGSNPDTNTVVVYKPPKSLLSSKISAEKYWSSDSLEGAPYHLFEGTVYIEDFITHGVVANNRVLVPIEALSALGNIHTLNNEYFLTYSDAPSVIATSFKVENTTSTPITVSVMDLYWQGRWVTKTTPYQLSPYASISRDAINDSTGYISSIVTTQKKYPFSISYFDFPGQLHTTLFETNDRVDSIGDISQLGNPISLSEIIWAEDAIRSMNLTSQTPFLIWTDLKTQKTYIFENRDNEWYLLKHFLCSSGKASSPTPTGEYELTRKVPYFGVEKGYRCKNAFGFIGTTYLYHSVMFDVTGSYELQGKGSLGHPYSAGCIRLSPENSLWLYDNMLSGTKVYIH